jgi:predicted AAA+ superfamily ATPase
LYLKRNIDKILTAWKNSPQRKPLVLRGARQTGKSSSIREFSKQFDLFLELNLERFEDLSFVKSCSSAKELVTALKTKHNLVDFPKDTLLFLDEVQENPDVVRWLRFFKEDYPQLAVVAAGSYMEVKLQERGFSFPVGRVTFRTLFPFSFFEFLNAVQKDVLADTLLNVVENKQVIPGPIHQQALALLRDYMLVGGMPEAVSCWLEQSSGVRVRQVHADLVQSLAEDIHKYKAASDLEYIEAAFENLKFHYGKRFKYENFAPGYKSQIMKTALTKLEAAMLVTRVWPTSSLKLPIQIRPKSAPKLLPLDIGIALYTMGSGFDELRTQPIDQLLNGRVAEFLVGQLLRSAQSNPMGPLHFWVSESSKNSAEVDFLLQGPQGLVPIEVKSGATGSLKSLHQFLWRSGLQTGYRFYSGNCSDDQLNVQMQDGNLNYRLISWPLYLAEKINFF